VSLTDSQEMISAECREVERVLLEKNAAYGNSALEPLRIFSRADATEQIRVRIDDKLSRLARGQAAGEDVVLDLIGYLILLRVAKKMHAQNRLANQAARHETNAATALITAQNTNVLDFCSSRRCLSSSCLKRISSLRERMMSPSSPPPTREVQGTLCSIFRAVKAVLRSCSSFSMASWNAFAKAKPFILLAHIKRSFHHECRGCTDCSAP